MMATIPPQLVDQPALLMANAAEPDAGWVLGVEIHSAM